MSTKINRRETLIRLSTLHHRMQIDDEFADTIHGREREFERLYDRLLRDHGVDFFGTLDVCSVCGIDAPVCCSSATNEDGSHDDPVCLSCCGPHGPEPEGRTYYPIG